MSNKRYALSTDDVQVILAALKHLHRASIINPEAFPQYELASKQRMTQIEAKLAPNNLNVKESEE
jgi:hypothetical protein